MRETGNLIFVEAFGAGKMFACGSAADPQPAHRQYANTAKPAADGDPAHNGSWPDIQDGKHFLLRSAPRPATSLNLRAAGVALPRRRLIPLHQPGCRRSV
jgi:hypothetical protein